MTMNRQLIGIFLVLLLLGAGAGYALASATTAEPGRAAGPAPVDAESPSAPIEDPREILPDPTDPPLGLDLETQEAVLRDGRRAPALKLQEPVGWRRTHVPGSDWNYAVEGNSTNTYKLRVGILKGSHVSVDAALASRLVAYEAAEGDGNLEDFEVEDRSADTFIATYLDGGYLRVTMERFVVLDDSDEVYAVVAVTGREVDRPGLTDLLIRTAGSMEAEDPLVS